MISERQRADYPHGPGVTDLEPVFEIGSVGKTFTTTLLALMVREGMAFLGNILSDCLGISYRQAVMERVHSIIGWTLDETRAEKIVVLHKQGE